ncbi:MAG: hypothetical protein JRH18_13400 [Deltaproteobacteria bacterium]|nr:hypothetical protein [Deltaproteobacteria bacterium]MBW2152651.1 hypothetical protein [Deltaproteobacteria bacterium]
MAISNSERIGKGLELLRNGLVPFVERELKAEYGKQWLETVRYTFPKDKDAIKDGAVQWDAHRILMVMWEQWNSVFKKTLGHDERNYVSELRDVRNRWAHQNAFTYDDTYRALDTMARLLRAVSAKEAEEIEKMAQETMRVRFAEQARQEVRKKSVVSLEGSPRNSSAVPF